MFVFEEFNYSALRLFVATQVRYHWGRSEVLRLILYAPLIVALLLPISHGGRWLGILCQLLIYPGMQLLATAMHFKSSVIGPPVEDDHLGLNPHRHAHAPNGILVITILQHCIIPTILISKVYCIHPPPLPRLHA